MKSQVFGVLLICMVLAGSLSPVFSYQPQTSLGGAAWLNYGRVEAISDTSFNKFQNNWLMTPGFMANIVHHFNERTTAVIGFGGVLFYPGMDQVTNATFLYKINASFLSHFYSEYTIGDFLHPFLNFKMGYFPNNWNPYRSNFGNYLLTGLVSW